jgi:hypothetical protein
MQFDANVNHNGSQVCSNICVILRLGGERLLNECFHHHYSLIDSVSISNKK